MKIKQITLAALLLPALVIAQNTATSVDTTNLSQEEQQRLVDSLYNPVTFDTNIENVKVKYRETRAEQRGDSLIYNASAFKVLDGSSAEDLLAKMPGIVVESGTVQAQGEEVKKIMVDGREFFEGDVSLAIKSLPSDIIESVEVFDKASDQAEFTGFDDGNQTKTINLVTKEDFKVGKFGEVYAGYGTNDRYKVGANVNIFGETQRITILGLSNNINQQNFSQDDIASVMTSSSGSRGGSSGTMISNLSGVTTSNALGFNFTDEWGKKVNFTGSYFFNMSDNVKEQDSETEYLEESLLGQTYEEVTNTNMDNKNHRAYGELEYKIDSRNILTIKPRFSMQDNISEGYGEERMYLDGVMSSGESSDTYSDTKAYSVSTEATFRHRFKKVGRTVSLSVTGSLSDTDKDSYAYYTSLSDDVASDDKYTQTSTQKSSLSANLTYTEQLHKKLQLSATYKYSYTNSDSDRRVYYKSSDELDDFNLLQSDLSSTYISDYITNSAGLGLRYNYKDLMISVSADAQRANLLGTQTYPSSGEIDNVYNSILPSAFGKWTINTYNSLMFRYRSSTSNPSISDLQDVIDNSSPYFVSTGNPDLDQETTHSANVRYVYTSTSGKSFIAMVNASLRNDYIGTSTRVLTEDETIGDITLLEGAQFSQPVNLDGYYSASLNLTYGFPLDFIRSNINLSLTTNITNKPTIFDGVESNTRDLTFTPKIVIGSNISEKVDFTVTYSSSISEALSTASGSTTEDYVQHNSSTTIGWEIWNGITLKNSLSYVGYTGIEMDDPNYFLWSASLGKKFLKNNKGELRLEAIDILNENQAFRRSVGSNYVEYISSNVLKSYFMLTFQYTFR